jgi:hypothetical protein
MNQEKAREFFSAYYEGTLETGLRQTLEQKLREDVGLRREFREYEETIERLDSLRFESIQPPADLHDIISSRIDRHRLEAKKTAQPSWQLWVRNLAIAGVAAAALVGAILNLRPSTGGAITSGVAGAATQQDLRVTTKGDQVILGFSSITPKTVVIHDGWNGPELRRISLDAGQLLASPLVNGNADAAVYDVQVVGNAGDILVAVPGSRKLDEPAGQGTLQDFAKALAGYFRTTVQVKASNLSAPITWNFQSQLTAREAAVASLGPTQYAVDQRDAGVVYIADH